MDFLEVTVATIFRLSSLLVMPFWALMLLLPRWRWTRRIMHSPFVSVAPAALYGVLVAPRLLEIWPALARPTLDGIALLLGSPAGATIAWIHFLAFDLFVGRWVYLDSQEKQISPWFTTPLLFLTLMLGPLGFLLYLTVRSALSLRVARDEDERDARETFDKRTKAANERPNAAQMTNKNMGSAVQSFRHTAGGLNRPLAILGGVMLVVLLGTMVGLIVDHRVITGVPAWLKPAKFAISISIYSFTFAWLLSFVENRPRLVRWTANLTVVSMVVEMAIIAVQAARGTTSHFNMTTTFNAVLWNMMGSFVILAWSMTLLLAIALIRQRMADQVFAWSLRLGVLVALVGMTLAFLMPRPTPAQLTALTMHTPTAVGAHSVGVPDGGPGLPIVGWSTVGGDLRAAHFLGLHALQVLPFLGWLLTRRRKFAFLNEKHRMALLWTAGLGYLGVVLLLLWQALRGQSIIHPDSATTAAAVALVTAVVLAVSATLGSAWSMQQWQTHSRH